MLPLQGTSMLSSMCIQPWLQAPRKKQQLQQMQCLAELLFDLCASRPAQSSLSTCGWTRPSQSMHRAGRCQARSHLHNPVQLLLILDSTSVELMVTPLELELPLLKIESGCSSASASDLGVGESMTPAQRNARRVYSRTSSAPNVPSLVTSSCTNTMSVAGNKSAATRSS